MRRIVTILGAVLFIAFTANAQEAKTVTGEGSAKIVKGDTKSAKESALTLAMRNAVEQVGSEIISETVVEDFELVKDEIISRARGYIHEYKILEEGKRGDEYYVKISAVVSAKEVKDDATFIYKKMDKPRVIVMLTEMEGGSSNQSKIAENTLSEYLMTKELSILDAESVKAKIGADSIRLAAEGDVQSAKKIGALSGAEVIITGTVRAGAPESVKGVLYSSRGYASIRVMNGETGEIYAFSTVEENGVDGSADGSVMKAIKNASTKVAHDIFSKMLKKWNEFVLNGRNIEVLISGVNFGELKELKTLIGGLEGVKEVIQRNYESPSVIFDVRFIGKSERLAELLTATGFKGKKFNVTSIQPNKIVLKIGR
jgi:hypothetical protein